MVRKKSNKDQSKATKHYLINVSIDPERLEAERLFTYVNLKDVPLSRIVRGFIYEKMMSKEIDIELKDLITKRKMFLRRSEEIRGSFK
jgi:hypothetical protein